jgi:hypothetical protein
MKFGTIFSRSWTTSSPINVSRTRKERFLSVKEKPFLLYSGRLEIVDFGSGRGRSDFAIAGAAENCKERKHRSRQEDAVYG